MDRWSGGVKLPHIMIETLTSPSSDRHGYVEFFAKYKPKAIGTVFVQILDGVASNKYFLRPSSLVGNEIKLLLYQFKYSQAMSIAGVNSGSSGSDPHTHSINYGTQNLTVDVLTDAGIGSDVAVMYEVD